MESLYKLRRKLMTTTLFLITRSVHHLIVRVHMYSLQTVDNILETVMCCDKLLATLPNVRWAEPVFGITSQLLESSIKFIANNFCTVLSSDRYIYWIWFEVKVMLWNWMTVNCKLKIYVWNIASVYAWCTNICICMHAHESYFWTYDSAVMLTAWNTWWFCALQ